jgi:serine/threonine protein kinase
VSQPYNVKHQVHVDFNSSTGFSGLPREWERLLQGNISKSEVLENPDAVLDVLEFHDKVEKRNRQNEAAAATEMPADRAVTLQELVSQGDPTTMYVNLKKIGEGAAGEVFSADNVSSGLKVAIKKMPLNAQNLKLLTSEIHIMKESHHGNVVGYYDSFLVENRLWLVIEHMGGGCLTEVLEQFDSCRMGEEHISWVCAETLRGLKYIHSLHRIHRDIKSDNILVGTAGEVKIADFGYAAQLSEAED